MIDFDKRMRVEMFRRMPYILKRQFWDDVEVLVEKYGQHFEKTRWLIYYVVMRLKKFR